MVSAMETVGLLWRDTGNEIHFSEFHIAERLIKEHRNLPQFGHFRRTKQTVTDSGAAKTKCKKSYVQHFNVD
jgi:hypothetical protein